MASIFVMGCQSDDDMGISDYCLENAGDPNCPNYDPCFEVFPADSEFEAIDSFFIGSDTSVGVVLGDTIANGSGFIFFRTARNNPRTTYSWQVGQDPREFTDPKLNLLFDEFEGTIDVNLEVSVPNTNGCLVGSELTSSSSKTYTFVELGLFDEWLVSGQYRGTLKEGGNTIDGDLLLTMTGRDQDDPLNGFRLFGMPIPTNCNNLENDGIPFFIGYSHMVSRISYEYRDGECPSRRLALIGRLTPGDQNEITIDYWLNNDNGKRIKRTFVGRRIQ
ncbi:MAG: hypothetical protein AAFN65_07170 [Bacteroidota bacterium]